MLSFYLQLSHSRKGQVNQSELACSAQVTLPALRLLTAPYKWHYCCLAAKLCPVLFDPLDRSSPVSPAQSRILEWVATPSSKESSRSRDGTHISCLLHWQVHSLPLAPAYFSKIKSQNKNQPTKKTKTIETEKSRKEGRLAHDLKNDVAVSSLGFVCFLLLCFLFGWFLLCICQTLRKKPATWKHP